MDRMQIFLNDVKQTNLLSREEEIELSKLIEKGDHAARDRMISSNIRLVINLAKKHASKGIEIEDLIQESSIGLIKAVDRFDWRKGYKFSTYACWWIKQSIRSHIASHSGSIKLPNHARNTLWKMREIINDYKLEFGIEPTNEEIADLLGTTVETLQSIITCTSPTVRLDDSPSRSEDGESSKRSWQDLIIDHGNENPEEKIDRLKLMDAIRRAFDKLTPREEIILRLRFGITEDFENEENENANA